ncbi:MAG: hypothetical protein ACP5OA_07255 [Candidatus Woesearchaeota archaeon]
MDPTEIQERVRKARSNLLPVSGRDILRRDGRFYIDYKYDSFHKQFLIQEQEILRIAKTWNLDPKNEIARLRGRITELIVLREIFDLLWKYRRGFNYIKYESKTILDLVRVGFHENNHELTDIYIPFVDQHIDCKNRWSPENVYPSQVKRINEGDFSYNAVLQYTDLSKIDALKKHVHDFNLYYVGANYSIPNKIDENGNHTPLYTNNLETSIIVNSMVNIKDIEISSLSDKKVLPKDKAVGFFDFMKVLEQEAIKQLKPKHKKE